MFQNKKIEVETVVPQNVGGSSNDSYAAKQFDNHEKASEFYKIVLHRLMNVSQWSEFLDPDSFVFELLDPLGHLKNDSPKLQDKIRVQLPGLKNQAGQGYDWVEVVRTENGSIKDTQFFLLELSPCECPYDAEERTAHFYNEKATNTFILALKENLVQLSIHSRNEMANTEDQTTVDKIRNFLVANTGKLIGSKIQWEVFSDNMMKDGE